MLEVDIPGFGALRIAYLVLDYNGTLARDGELLPGVQERLNKLAAQVEVHVITADTFGKAHEQLRAVACDVTVIDSGYQAEAKMAFVQKLGAEVTATVGNGRNDWLMLGAAALGVAVVGGECAAAEALAAADVIAPDGLAALDLLLNPGRLIATLRS